MMRTYCRTRTRPAHTGIFVAPRSVAETARSSRSLRSGSRDTEAARTELAHDGAMPSPTWSASARTSVSTRARCTPVACGTDVRAAPVSSLPADPRSRWRRLSGSGLSRENHAVTCQPVARLARSRVESATALTTVGTPAASAKASSSAATRSLDRVGTLPVPVAASRRWAAERTSASSRARVTFFSATRLAINARSSWMPQPWRALTGSTGTPPRPSASSRRRTSSTMPARRSSGTVSMWLSTTSITSLCPARGLRNRSWMAASAYFCGSRTHTIMSASWTSRSTSRWWDTSVESWSGRSSSTTPRISTSSSAFDSIESRVTWWRAGMPSHSRSSSAPCLPHTTAVAHEVVGRRTPTAASSSPLSALNMEDLPDPVAPPRATTVCSADSLSRLEARAATAVASSTTASSTRPRAASAARSSPSTRAPVSELRVTSFLAPSSNDVMGSSPSEWCCCAPPTLGGVVLGLRHPVRLRRRRRRPFGGAACRGEAQVVYLAGSGAHALGRLGRDFNGVAQVGVAAALGVEEVAHGRLELAAGALGQRAHGLVAEHRLEHLLPEDRGAAGDAGLGTGDTRGVGEHHDHQGHGQAVDAEGEEACRRALLGALGADHVEHVGLPVADRALGAAAEVAGRPAEVLAGVAQQDLSGGRAAPRRLGALGGGLGVLEDERLEAGLDRHGDPLGLLRLALDGIDDAVPDPPDARLERAEQLAGADELLPARQDLAAQQGAVGRRLADGRHGPVVGLVGVLAQAAYGVDLLGGGVGHRVRTTSERADRAVEGLLHHRLACLLVVGERAEPLPDLHHRRRGQQPQLGDLALLDDEERGVLEAAAGQHPGEVRGDGVHRLGRGAVEDDGDRGRAVRGLAEEVPGHLVGVARGRGDEEPQVGGGEQLGRQHAVLLLDRVDVGCVEDGEAGRHDRRRHELQRGGVVGLAVDPLELGQQAVLAEPLRVVGVVDEHRRPGRGAQHTGRGDAGADQRVDQRRLAGAGGAADDREERRVEGHQARDDVVLELVDHLRAGAALLVRSGELEREASFLQGTAQAHQRGHHRGRGVGGAPLLL